MKETDFVNYYQLHNVKEIYAIVLLAVKPPSYSCVINNLCVGAHVHECVCGECGKGCMRNVSVYVCVCLYTHVAMYVCM